MKKFKFIVTIILSLAFLIKLTLVEYVPVEAAVNKTSTYVALGDSITTGYGLVNFNENDNKNKLSENNFVNKLSKKLGKKAVNLGVEGIDSTRFLQAISRPTTSQQKEIVNQIKKADIITISIGGNNVFLPLLEILNKRIGKGKNIFKANTQEIQTAVLGLLFDKNEMNRLQNEVIAGALKFNGDAALKKAGDFDNILKTIKTLNPKAQILVQTIYNPYRLPLIGFFDDAIKLMNAKIIKDSANGRNYKVADVYSAFLKANPGTKLLNSDFETFDPHPTAKGHEVIYTIVAYAAQNNTLPYNVKATIIKGKLITTVSEGELILTITPIKGFKTPKSISLTIGKGARKTLDMTNGKVSMPISEVNAEILVSAVCFK